MSRIVNVEQWQLFVQVAETASLTKVAARRNTAQPVVSRQIAALERKCRGRLFDRTGRGVTLTEAGKRILPRVKAWLGEAELLADDVRATIGVPVGVVRVGVLPSTGHLLPSLVFQRARDQFPGIQLRILNATSAELSEWLKTGNIDIAILFRIGKESGADDHPIAVVDTFLVGSAKDTVTKSATIDFARIDKLPLILPGEPNALRRVLHQIAQKKHISLSVVMECNSLAIQKDVVADGGGYTILGSNAMVHELQIGRLQASKIVSPGIQRTITLAISRRRPPTLACAEVAKLIRVCVDQIAGSLIWKSGFTKERHARGWPSSTN